MAKKKAREATAGTDKKSKFHEIVIKEFEPLRHMRVRIVKNQKGKVFLDIREFIDNDEYTGFTRKGIRLNYDDVQYLMRELESIFMEMDKA